MRAISTQRSRVSSARNEGLACVVPAGFIISLQLRSRAASILDSSLVGLARLDTHGALDRPDEDFAIATPARVSDAHNRLNYQLDHFVARDDLKASLLDVFDKVFDDAVWRTLFVCALLTPKAAHVRDGHAGETFDLFKRVCHLAEHKRLHHRGNYFHGASFSFSASRSRRASALAHHE